MIPRMGVLLLLLSMAAAAMLHGHREWKVYLDAVGLIEHGKSVRGRVERIEDRANGKRVDCFTAYSYEFGGREYRECRQVPWEWGLEMNPSEKQHIDIVVDPLDPSRSRLPGELPVLRDLRDHGISMMVFGVTLIGCVFAILWKLSRARTKTWTLIQESSGQAC